MDLDVHTTARERLVSELREHALVIGEVVLTSGKTAQYLVDAKRAILRPAGFTALAVLVEDVTTTGGSTIRALEAVRDEGHQVCGVLVVCDRLAGGAEAIEQAFGVPVVALTTIDDVYPERPDR